MEPESPLVSLQEAASQRPCVTVFNEVDFDGEELLAPRPIPNLEDHVLSGVCGCFPDSISLKRSLD